MIEHSKGINGTCPDDMHLMFTFIKNPHECSDKTCPGNINRRKLALLASLLSLSRDALEHIEEASRGFSEPEICVPLRRAIAEAEEVAGDN